MYEIDDVTKPITFRSHTDEGKAQYSLTRSEGTYMARLLGDFLNKEGPLP